MLQVTVRQLEVFAEAAAARSYARAAETLNVSPAAISFQIRQIEDTIGAPLFERVGRDAVLTGPGRALLGHAQTVLQALRDAEKTLRDAAGLDGGDITIGIVSTSKYLVPHLLARFRAEHPAVTIHLQDGNRPQIFEALIKGRVDLAVTGRPPDDAGLTAASFADHPSVIVAQPDHPLAARAALAAADLVGEPFIAREDGSGTRQLMDAFFLTAGARPSLALTSSSNETIKQAVMAGMGLALMSRHTVGLELRLGLLRVLPVQGFPVMRAWFVVHRSTMTLPPIHRRLRCFLLERGQAIIGELEGG